MLREALTGTLVMIGLTLPSAVTSQSFFLLIHGPFARFNGREEVSLCFHREFCPFLEQPPGNLPHLGHKMIHGFFDPLGHGTGSSARPFRFHPQVMARPVAARGGIEQGYARTTETSGNHAQ